MLSKESKLRVLENFYSVDYALFGKPVREMSTCCPVLRQEYLASKGALLSVVIEMMKHAQHEPKTIAEYVDSQTLLIKAKRSARLVREYVEKLVSSPKSRRDIKVSVIESLKEDKTTDLVQLTEDKIKEKAFSLALDTLLVSRVLKESKMLENFNDVSGRILEDSYKILRDSLVAIALEIVKSTTND